MADYNAHLNDLRAAGGEIAGISVDDPDCSEPVRQALKLGFTLLCDTRREAVRAFGLINAREGDIALPAVFVIDRREQVRLRVIEGTHVRANVSDVIGAARAVADGREVGDIEADQRRVWPGRMFVRAIMNMIARGLGPRHPAP